MSFDSAKNRASTLAAVSCLGKVSFDTFTQANAILKRNSTQHRAGRSSYHCIHCHKWHIGTSNGAREGKKAAR
jgi:hypothetical protein